MTSIQVTTPYMSARVSLFFPGPTPVYRDSLHAATKMPHDHLDCQNLNIAILVTNNIVVADDDAIPLLKVVPFICSCWPSTNCFIMCSHNQGGGLATKLRSV